jgi:hypothetical protein
MSMPSQGDLVTYTSIEGKLVTALWLGYDDWHRGYYLTRRNNVYTAESMRGFTVISRYAD